MVNERPTSCEFTGRFWTVCACEVLDGLPSKELTDCSAKRSQKDAVFWLKSEMHTRGSWQNIFLPQTGILRFPTKLVAKWSPGGCCVCFINIDHKHLVLSV